MAAAPRSPRSVFAVIAAGGLLVSLDVSVANALMPAIGADFHGDGRAAVSWVITAYAIVFAITGFLLNLASLRPDGSVPLLTLAWTLPISLVSGYGAVAALARLLGPVLSSKEQEATTRQELVGQVGVVISSRVSPEFGEVRVKDKSGLELRVVCKLAQGDREPKEREQVVFVDCDDEGRLLVSPLDSAR